MYWEAQIIEWSGNRKRRVGQGGRGLEDMFLLFGGKTITWHDLAKSMTQCYAVTCYVMLYYVILCYAMLCYAILCYAMLCYVMLYYVMLYYAKLCYAVLCYAMLWFALLTTSESAHACVSTLSCPDTVRQQRRPKKSFEKSTWPALSTGMSATLASSG